MSVSSACSTAANADVPFGESSLVDANDSMVGTSGDVLGVVARSTQTSAAMTRSTMVQIITFRADDMFFGFQTGGVASKKKDRKNREMLWWL